MLSKRNFISCSFFVTISCVVNPAWSKNRSPRPKVNNYSNKSARTASRLISQSERRGGHFNQRHVGRSVGFLKARSGMKDFNKFSGAKKSKVRRSISRSTKSKVSKSLKNHPKKMRRTEFSTFANQKVAQALMTRAIERNREKIRAWIKSGSRKPLAIVTKAPASAGTVLISKTKRLVKPKQAVFILRKDHKQFRLHTGYLTSHNIGKTR